MHKPIGTVITRNGVRVEKRPHGWIDDGGNAVLVDESKIVFSIQDLITLAEQSVLSGDTDKALYYLNRIREWKR